MLTLYYEGFRENGQRVGELDLLPGCLFTGGSLYA